METKNVIAHLIIFFVVPLLVVYLYHGVDIITGALMIIIPIITSVFIKYMIAPIKREKKGKKLLYYTVLPYLVFPTSLLAILLIHHDSWIYIAPWLSILFAMVAYPSMQYCALKLLKQPILNFPQWIETFLSAAVISPLSGGFTGLYAYGLFYHEISYGLRERTAQTFRKIFYLQQAPPFFIAILLTYSVISLCGQLLLSKKIYGVSWRATTLKLLISHAIALVACLYTYSFAIKMLGTPGVT